MHVCALRGNVRSSVMDEQSRPSWTDHLSPVGLHYFAGVVENAEDLIERHKVLSALLEREAPPRKLTLVPLVAKKIMMKQLQPRYLLQFKVGANVDENFIPPSVNTCTKVVVKKHKLCE